MQSNFNIDLRDERRNDRQIIWGGKYSIAKMHITIYNILIRSIHYLSMHDVIEMINTSELFQLEILSYLERKY